MDVISDLRDLTFGCHVSIHAIIQILMPCYKQLPIATLSSNVFLKRDNAKRYSLHPSVQQHLGLRNSTQPLMKQLIDLHQIYGIQNRAILNIVCVQYCSVFYCQLCTDLFSSIIVYSFNSQHHKNNNNEAVTLIFCTLIFPLPFYICQYIKYYHLLQFQVSHQPKCNKIPQMVK